MPAAGGGPSTSAVARITLTVAGVVLGLYALYVVRSVLILVFISAFLALAFGPAVEFFARRGLPRTAAILSTYLAIFAAIVGVGSLIVPPVVNGVNDLSKDIPGYVKDLRKSNSFRKYDNRYHISRKLNEQSAKLPSKLGDAAGALQSVTVGVFSALVQLVTVLTMTFFFLKDGDKIIDFLLRAFGHREHRYRAVSADIYRSVSGYVAGNLIISIVAGMVAWISLTALGVPFAVPLAVLVAFLDLIPLVGATIGAVVVGVVTLFVDFPTATIVWIIVIVVYQQLENHIVQPIVYRQTVDVRPLVVIVSILVGAALLGVLGALVAIPVAATAQILLRDWWGRRQRHRTDDVVLPPDVEPEAG